MPQQPILVRLRKELGFSAHEVAAEGRWSRQEFEELEKSGEIDTSDAIRLTDLYGVDLAAVLSAERLEARKLPVAALLKGNARVLTADARFSMTEAVSVSRDITALKEVLGLRPTLPVTSFGEDPDLNHPETGNAERLALQVRNRLKLSGVVESVVEDICEPLGIHVFVADFEDHPVDAFSVWSPESGALIVVNRRGGNAASPQGLRTTLSHEVCHLLFDREKMRQISSFCEVEKVSASSRNEKVEQRARAFQVELLAPKTDVLSRWRMQGMGDYATRIRDLAAFFGIGPVAAAWQLANAGGPDFEPVHTKVEGGPWPEWKQLLTAVPVVEAEKRVPLMRRRILLPLVKAAFLADEISTSWGRELLRLDAAEWDELQATWI